MWLKSLHVIWRMSQGHSALPDHQAVSRSLAVAALSWEILEAPLLGFADGAAITVRQP
jgi:hypothetical protein